MHVSRWLRRGYVSLIVGFLVPDLIFLYASEHKQEFPGGLTSSVNTCLFFFTVLLLIYSSGQFQSAYYFSRLYSLLKLCIGDQHTHRFVTSSGEDGIVTRYHDGFRIEIVTYDNFDKKVLIVTLRALYAHKQVVHGMVLDECSSGTLATSSVLCDVVMLSLDYRSEMKLLAKALSSQLSRS